jgi:BirA family transcriptional regulator, biotin operon repressor / biotin---[acetyl-CoA-carboxylase] ligase
MSTRPLLERLIAGPADDAALSSALAIDVPTLQAQLDQLRSAGVDIGRDAAGRAVLMQPVELLDRERVVAGLSRPAREELAALSVEFETPSTQQLALDAPVPARGSAVWFAERQTAGQGQRGRTWRSPLAAGVAFSASRRSPRGLADLSGLSLAVGAGAADAIRGLGFPSVGVKWPNDLVAGGRKLGGILIQLRGSPAGPSEVVVGIGVNVRLSTMHDAAIDQPWCDLAALRSTPPPSRHAVFVAILDQVLPALRRFDAEGLAPFLPRWRDLDALAQRPVRVLDGGVARAGVAVGVDDRGALRVSHDGVERLYHSGTVSLRPE